MRPAAETVQTGGLENTHWALKKLSGYEKAIEQPPTLSFSADRLTGFNGCNRIFANYATGPDGSISVGQPGSTRMACLGEAGDIEKRFNAALTEARLFAVSRDALNLMDAKRNILMVLSPKAPE
ncbi:MAG: META domain-containing protein [Thiolinea sp.]